MPQTTVLVIEDEPLIRMTVSDDLRDSDLRVIEAGNAEEALRLLETDSTVRAIFTDIDMPGSLDGLKLAWIVRDRWPPVEIVITSGQRRVDVGEMPERAVFFPKPYAHQPLIEALTRLTS
ncbi:response regulator [Rhizobium sp. S152]|uniref:response regulator n=1 Tax=Rhizobium sp. S152 TaxID=3055038 RepID=UPI0025A9688B|nr:response regulator [Rhizobium sp. S152]MDM9627750.1 response regulator [Rhizobium sp. S152]